MILRFLKVKKNRHLVMVKLTCMVIFFKECFIIYKMCVYVLILCNQS